MIIFQVLGVFFIKTLSAYFQKKKKALKKIRGRTRTYRVGYAFVVLATVAATVGLGAPGWMIRTDLFGNRHFFGLWQHCLQVRGGLSCSYLDYKSLDDYMKATQAMACIGVAILLASTLYGMAVNMECTDSPSSPFVETSAFLGGLSLFIGCMVWAAYRDKFFIPMLDSLGYAMILATASSVLAILASFLVAIGSHRGFTIS